MFLLTCWVSGLISRERSYQNLSKKSGVQKKKKNNNNKTTTKTTTTSIVTTKFEEFVYS